MHIRKLSHCCLVIDLKIHVEKGAPETRRILLDPGSYSLEKHRAVKDVDIVLITHEHADHFHIESLKEQVRHSPDLTVITNDAVGEILAADGIAHHVMRHGNTIDIRGVHIEAHGKSHAIMHKSIPPVSNIGFLIRAAAPQGGEGASEIDRTSLFFPGDALTDPGQTIDALALPVAGPWLKISEAIDYALAVKPRLAFPVHDAMRIPTQHLLPERVLGQNGIEFVKLEEGGELEINP